MGIDSWRQCLQTIRRVATLSVIVGIPACRACVGTLAAPWARLKTPTRVRQRGSATDCGGDLSSTLFVVAPHHQRVTWSRTRCSGHSRLLSSAAGRAGMRARQTRGYQRGEPSPLREIRNVDRRRFAMPGRDAWCATSILPGARPRKETAAQIGRPRKRKQRSLRCLAVTL